MSGERKGKSAELSIYAYNFISNRLSIHKRYTDRQLLPKTPPRFEKMGMVYAEEQGERERRGNEAHTDTNTSAFAYRDCELCLKVKTHHERCFLFCSGPSHQMPSI